MAVCDSEERQVFWITNRISQETVVYANAVVQDYETFSLAHHRNTFNVSRLTSIFFCIEIHSPRNCKLYVLREKVFQLENKRQ